MGKCVSVDKTTKASHKSHSLSRLKTDMLLSIPDLEAKHRTSVELGLSDTVIASLSENGVQSGLSENSDENATVLRNGSTIQIHSNALVPGDIIFLKRNDIVNADTRLVETHHFKLNNQHLTGDTVPVSCGTEAESEDPLTAKNLAFCGAVVVKGNAKGIVLASKARSYASKHHHSHS
jgi:P-type E1-E2 ATPase